MKIDAVTGISGIKEVANDSAPSVGRRPSAPKQEVMGARHSEAAAELQRTEQAVREVQSHLSKLDTKLRIEVDGRHDVVVKVIDGESEEVIRQIPSEDFIAIKRRMEELSGLLLDAKT